MLGTVRQNVCFALRSLRRSPGFAVLAILTLGLGIGATTAIFSVVRSVVLDPLDYPDPGRLVVIDQPVPNYDADHPWPVSEAGYWDYREHVPALSSLGAYSRLTLDVSGLSVGARRVPAVKATASLLQVLGARPAVGRVFGPADDRPDAAPVAMLSWDYWERAFGGDSTVVGTTVRIDGHPVPVIGVLARGFRLPRHAADVWVPARLDPSATPVNAHYLDVVGRLAPGATLGELESQLERREAGFTRRYPQAYSTSFMRQFGLTVEARPLRDWVLGEVGRGLWILLGAISLVLLIACANVANLFLARTEARRRELAVRAALGAGRWRLAGLCAAESLVLSVAAGALAVWIAHAGVGLLLRLQPLWLPRLANVGVGVSGAAFALGVALAAGVVFGLLPVFWTKTGPEALSEGTRGTTASTAEKRTRSAFVVGQVALAVLLVAAGALLLRSYARLRSVEPGFGTRNKLALNVALPAKGYPDYATSARFWRRARERVRQIPGVAAVGAGQGQPLEGANGCATLPVEGHPEVSAGAARCIPKESVTPGYFRALGIPVRGRLPTWRDVDDSTGAILVTRTLARQLWPGEDAIGKGLGRASRAGGRYYRVVGVTGNLRMDGLDQPPTPVAFFPIEPASDSLPLWGPVRLATLVVRSSGPPAQSLSAPVRRTLARLDPDVAVGNARTLGQVVSRSTGRTTFVLLLIGLAGGLALVLAAVGIYGVIAYLVEQRRGEIGVRMALGSTASRVGLLVLTETLGTVAVGLGTGLAAAAVLGRLLGSWLYQVSPADPLALAAAALVLLLVAVIASLVPALRATHVDPARALRAE